MADKETSQTRDTTLSCAQRMLLVQQAVDRIPKDGVNSHYGYRYVSSGAVLEAIRAAMNRVGLIMTIEILQHSMELGVIPASRGGAQHLTTLTLNMVWRNVDNPEDKIEVPWASYGIDNQEKGLAKALTMAEKYGLLRTFHISTEDSGDDPDAHEPGKGRAGGGNGQRRSDAEMAGEARARKRGQAKSGDNGQGDAPAVTDKGGLRALLLKQFGIKGEFHEAAIGYLAMREFGEGHKPLDSLSADGWGKLAARAELIGAEDLIAALEQQLEPANT